MINDLPNSLHEVETSLFADDSCIFKSGKNLKQITKGIQDNINKISHWCDLWGFKISLDKTVAVIFTQKKHDAPKLLINKNSSGDEIANVNFCTTTTYMERPAPTPIEPLLSTINIYGT